MNNTAQEIEIYILFHLKAQIKTYQPAIKKKS